MKRKHFVRRKQDLSANIIINYSWSIINYKFYIHGLLFGVCINGNINVIVQQMQVAQAYE